jgi:ammonia channel protein AmtB
LGYHDAPDPGIRRVSGILGILATGFASNGAKGLLSENPAQLGIQAVMVRAAAVFAFVGRLLGSRMREQSFGA